MKHLRILCLVNVISRFGDQSHHRTSEGTSYPLFQSGKRGQRLASRIRWNCCQLLCLSQLKIHILFYARRIPSECLRNHLKTLFRFELCKKSLSFVKIKWPIECLTSKVHSRSFGALVLFSWRTQLAKDRWGLIDGNDGTLSKLSALFYLTCQIYKGIL